MHSRRSCRLELTFSRLYHEPVLILLQPQDYQAHPRPIIFGNPPDYHMRGILSRSVFMCSSQFMNSTTCLRTHCQVYFTASDLYRRATGHCPFLLAFKASCAVCVNIRGILQLVLLWNIHTKLSITPEPPEIKSTRGHLIKRPSDHFLI